MINEYKVSAHFLLKRLSLLQILDSFTLGTLSKREPGFLLFSLNREHSYLYIKDYGGVVLFNVDEKMESEILTFLRLHSDTQFAEHIESLIVKVGGDEKLITNFNEIIIDHIDLEIVHIVSLNLAQSVALFHYQNLADEILEDTRKYTNELEAKGTLSLNRKRLLKYVGSTLNIKNKIIENLFIFNSPKLAWNDEIINRLDKSLNEEFEIEYRYNGIKEKLNIVQENLDLFKDLLLHKHSSLLEWIIIGLILFEVLHVIIEMII